MPALNACCVGDIMLARRQVDAAKSGGRGIVQPGAGAILEAADLVLGNLEAPLARDSEPLSPGRFRAPPEGVGALEAFDVLSLANNHIHDCGDGGIAETIAALAQANIQTVGLAEADGNPFAPALLVRGNAQIAVFACIGPECSQLPPTSRYRVATIADPQLVREIEAASKTVDWIVAMYHGGNECIPFPSPTTRANLTRLATAGAHLVVSHHPHVLGGEERTDAGQVIWYGLGDFIFDSELPERRLGGILQARLAPDEPVQTMLVPTWLSDDLTVDVAQSPWHAKAHRGVARVSRALGGSHYDAYYPLRYFRAFAGFQVGRFFMIARRDGFRSALAFAMSRRRFLGNYLRAWRRGALR